MIPAFARRSAWLPVATAAASGVAMSAAWSPFYWPVAVSIVSASAICIAWVFTAERVSLPWQTWLVVTLAAWGFVQLLVRSSVLPWATFRHSLVWVTAAATFVAASHILARARDREKFLRTFLWIAAALSICALLEAYNRPVRVFGLIPAAPSVVGTFVYKNQFAAMVELAAPIALWKMFSVRSQRAVMAVCFLTMFAAVVASAGRAGVGLVLLELFALLTLAVSRGRLSLRRASAAVAIFIVALAAASAVAGVDAIWARLHEKNPLSVRRQLLLSTLRMARERPLLGFGLGTWRIAYPRFATFDVAAFANEAHDDWAEWAAEGGFPFALCLFALVFSVLRDSIRSIWGIGVPVVSIHALVDYPLREPCILFLWVTLIAALVTVRTNSWRFGRIEVQS